MKRGLLSKLSHHRLRIKSLLLKASYQRTLIKGLHQPLMIDLSPDFDAFWASLRFFQAAEWLAA
ncbi:MAG: hypothetical protein ACRDA8_05740, partial [Shewanella sp.]